MKNNKSTSDYMVMSKWIFPASLLIILCVFIFIIARLTLVDTYSREVKTMTLDYFWKMEDKKVGDKDRIYDAIYNPKYWNLLKWKRKDFIKDKELYNKVCMVHKLVKTEEQIESIENDKTFRDRVNKLKGNKQHENWY